MIWGESLSQYRSPSKKNSAHILLGHQPENSSDKMHFSLKNVEITVKQHSIAKEWQNYGYPCKLNVSLLYVCMYILRQLLVTWSLTILSTRLLCTEWINAHWLGNYFNISFSFCVRPCALPTAHHPNPALTTELVFSSWYFHYGTHHYCIWKLILTILPWDRRWKILPLYRWNDE